jgi:hypothetical protein
MGTVCRYIKASHRHMDVKFNRRQQWLLFDKRTYPRRVARDMYTYIQAYGWPFGALRSRPATSMVDGRR